MKRKKAIILSLIAFILLSGCAGCAAKFASTKPVLDEDGEVFVFLQPFPQEAERLSFELESVAAVRQDGAEIPLALVRREFDAKSSKRQRIAAKGVLPPGMYRGLSFKASKAVLTTDEGEAALLTGEKPVTAELPFTISRRRASALFLKFLYPQATADGFSFKPVFSLTAARTPLTGLIGYVSNSGDNTITVFDKKAGQVVSVLATGKEPRGMVFDPVRSRAYVALAGEDAVLAIDMISGDPLHTIRLHAGSAPQDLALSADGRLLMSVNRGSSTVSFIDPLSYIELGKTAVGQDPAGILLGPSGGRRAYVFNEFSKSITVIDTLTRTAATTVATENGPYRGQFDKTGGRLYVVYQQTPFLTVLDPASLQKSAEAFIRLPSSDLKVDPTTDLIYVARAQGGEIEVYDPFALVTKDVIPTEDGASDLAIDGQENSLLLLSSQAGTLTSINLNTNNVVYVLDVGEGAYQVTLMGER
jgi:YVTN family beta-propeller protein